MKFKNLLLVCLMVLAFASAAPAASSVRIELKDGSTWRGELYEQVEVTFDQRGIERIITGELVKAERLYIVVEFEQSGGRTQLTIFNGDIVKMRTVGEAREGAGERGSPPPAKRDAEERSEDAAADDSDDDTSLEGLPEIFVLPLEGTVGETFRHDEIEKIGEHADSFGPGQIIVLRITSNGGLVYESELITETIWDLKKRHRVVAWVEKAISAGCATAMACDEIYFMTEGTAGSVTTIRGLEHVPEEEAQPGIDYLVEIAKKSGYSEHIARAMKLKKYMVSYDKDPETGEVTWYGDLSGEHILSDGDSNLTFNSSKALHCGFSRGTADTTEDLAKLLDLPKWRETDEYGRRIAEEWQETVERCKEEVPRLVARRQYKNSASGDPVVRLGTIIQINNELIRWIERCTWPCRLMGLPEKEYFERENELLRKQIADLRRQRR